MAESLFHTTTATTTTIFFELSHLPPVRMNRDRVISGAVRLYFRIERENVIVAGARQIDNEILKSDLAAHGRLIANAIR